MVNTVFDSTRSDSTIYQKYFGFNASLGTAKGTALATRVPEQVQLALNSKFEEFALLSTGPVCIQGRYPCGCSVKYK